MRFVSLFHQLMFYYQYLHYTICISGIIHYVSKYHSKSLFNAHWNLFWSKSSMELSPVFHGTFLNKIWTTFVVPWNSMELKQQNLKFHGIPWNFVQIQSSMEFHGTFTILPSSMEFHGTFLKFHGIPWNFMELDKFDIIKSQISM